MSEFRELPAKDFLEMALPLLAEHREELATDKARMILAPDHETYLALDGLGRMLTIGVFKDDALIGYSANIIAPHLHYSGLTVCQNDVLWLRPEWRVGRLGLRLIRETEERARGRGADMMVWHAKPGTSLNAIMTARRDAAVQDICWKVNL